MLTFSIVVNTYNRAQTLEDCLQGLSELSYADYEVIVVKGPSADHTDAVVEKWRGKIKVGTCAEANLSMSRNVGIEMASGDVIAFVDDDAICHPAWLNQLAPHYSDPKVGGAGGFTIDNTGTGYQVRKTVCDRYGNAFNPSDFFDERPLCFPYTPLYPSLLGANSSFRASALREIGGFDHTFAYFLDESDVCLRLVDHGFRIIYVPEALIFHQFASSHLRDKNRVPKTLYPSAVSKAYFIRRHGAEHQAEEEIRRYEGEILGANQWLAEHGQITSEHRVSLDDDLLFGLQEGTQRAMQKLVSNQGTQGDLDLSKMPGSFLPMERKPGLRIAFVSRSFPPHNEAGIARWTWMMASGLAERGHKVHVITLAVAEPWTRYEKGYWVHAIKEDQSDRVAKIAAQRRIPPSVAAWSSAVEHQVQALKEFGLDVVSFPIWDLEGLAVMGDEALGVVVSLHTTYAMARSFKPEWTERPLFAHFHVEKIITAEAELLRNAPYILANSEAIVDDLTNAYAVDFRARTSIVPHGTTDPLRGGGSRNGEKPSGDRPPGGPLRVTYVGRFELRKGFDIACAAFVKVLDEVEAVEICIAGDSLNEISTGLMEDSGAKSIARDPRVHFRGNIARTRLNQLYLESDVVIMPSRYESFGLVAIEAMAAGAPVIALAAGGLKEVVEDGTTGFLVPVSENAAGIFADRIKQLASNPKLLASMKAAARAAFLQRYTVERMTEAAEAVYLNAARRKS